jgi:hypothetical protein
VERLGEGCGEPPEGVEDVPRLRAKARDLRNPWAEDGRPGELARPPELDVSADGGDGDHGFSARAASNWRKFSQGVKVRCSAYLFTILGGCPTIVGVVSTHTLLISALI